MARSLGLLALFAPALALGWLALPHDEHVPVLAAGIPVVVTWALSALALSGRLDAQPRWVFALLLALAPLLVAPFIVYSDDADSGFVLLFAWAAPYAFCWFSLRWAVLQTLFAGAVFLAARAVSPYDTESLTEMAADTVLLVATITAIGLFARALTGAVRRQAGLRAHRERVLAEFGRQVLDSDDPGAVIGQALTITIRELRADVAVLGRFDTGRGLMLLEDIVAPGIDRLSAPGTEVPGGADSLLALGMREGGVVTPDLWDDPRLRPLPGARALHAGMAVAVRGRGGEPIGALAAYSEHVAHFSPDDVAFLESLANLVAAAKSHVASDTELRHRALHDPLTGLPNRTLLADRLARALQARTRRGGQVAVILVDVDRFKHVNDSLGHPVGDQLLVALAARLDTCVRADDTLARMGGDEFVVVAEGVTGSAHARQIADRLATAWTRPLQLDGRRLHVQASVGVALSDAATTADELLANADVAMYRGKELGSGRVELFDDGLRERASQRLLVEQELRRGLDAHELVVHYQPIVDPASGACTGLEALVRWRHPQRGLLAPSEFIATAEESGLVGAIGERVLDLALRQAAGWRAQPGRGDVSVAVNVSPAQLREPDYAEQVAAALRRHDLPPEALVLEITEHVLVLPDGPAAQTARSLRTLGVHLALDDFGTGYSSLSSLRSLPISSLKVDRSFVAGLGVDDADTGVVEGTLRMAAGARLRVVAEGVETAEQARRLADMGCDAAQGYFFARPLDGEAADDYLRATAGTAAPQA